MKKLDRFMAKFVKTATFISATLLLIDAGIKLARKTREIIRKRQLKKAEKRKVRVAAA